MKPFLQNRIGRSKKCGHECLIVIKGYRNNNTVVGPLKQIAKICRECNIGEKITKDIIKEFDTHEEEK